ncbi:MAG: O-antigen ligase family protein [Hyphomonadaceae bacterium]|nr:O-antigen ligase family protein [Hyphomonadaceae bacterium]
MATTKLSFGALAIAGLTALVPAAAVAGGMALAPLQAAAGLLGAPWRRLPGALARYWPLVAVIVAFFGWTAVATFWSPYVAASEQAARLAGLAATALLLIAGAGGAHERDRALMRAACVAAAGVAAALLLIEAIGDMPLNRMDEPATVDATQLLRNPAKGASVLLLLLWPAMAALVGGAAWERTIWRILFAAAAFLMFQFDMQANTLAFGAGLAAFLVAQRAPGFALGVCFFGLAAWMLAAPFATPLVTSSHAVTASLPDSWAIRAEMWTYITNRIPEAFVLGHGLDATRVITVQGEVRGIVFNMVSLHPHSASLHIWYELGAIGAGLAALALAIGGITAIMRLRAQREAAAALAGLAASTGVIANVSYGAWQEWWLAAIVLAGAFVNAAKRG